MSDLKVWEEKIKEKRKKTPWREYLIWVCSWLPFSYYKNSWFISRYPISNRIKNLVDINNFLENEFSTDYDISKNFFEQLVNFQRKSTLWNILHYSKNENSDFSDIVLSSKNCYLSNSIIIDWLNVLYSFQVKENSHNIFNSTLVWNNSENIYFSSWIINSFKIFYSKFILNSNNIWFSWNLNWCNECILCNNLENKFYCIKNKQFDKETYLKEKKKILESKKSFINIYLKLNIRWNNNWENIINSYFVRESENVVSWLMCYKIKNWRNIMFWWWKWDNENIYDSMSWWTIWNTDFYWVWSAWANSSNIYICNNITYSSNIYYSFHLENCSFCIWCIWLKNKSFCILNKQYSKEEWYELANKIFASMDANWILWDFFPWSLNPFYFNDTMAYLIDDSFTKEEVEAKWYMWRDSEIKVDIPDWAEIVKTSDLVNFQWFDSNWNWHINPEIMKKVIQDDNWNIYKIVPMEYEFLMKHNLPLPEIHWLDRIKLGFKFK